jgi:hypothetical protein
MQSSKKMTSDPFEFLRNLAVLAEERGDLASATEYWRGVVAECPGDHDALSALQRLGGAIA